MGRPSVIPILCRQLGDRLDQIITEWNVQAEGNRVPTLPLIDGKVNVRELARQSGFEGSQEQHLFKNSELKSMVNAVALEQGVEPVGSRTEFDAEHPAVVKRFRQAKADHSELGKVAAEREALIERLRRELASKDEQLALLESVGLVMRIGKVS
ncbi:hypothetical protein [Microvirga sp. P5_D2]